MAQSSPTILAFDTSAAHCAAALLSGGHVTASRSEVMGRGQAERLMVLVEEMMGDAGLDWSAIDAIGVGTGPGNFTGIRISVSAARGLAFALSRPAIGVSGLEAAVYGLPLPVLSVLPAPRAHAYIQHFATETTDDPQLVEALPKMVHPGVPLAGPGAEDMADGTRRVLTSAHPLAEAIAHLAAQRLGTPQPRPAPLYLRPADAAPSRDVPPVMLS